MTNEVFSLELQYQIDVSPPPFAGSGIVPPNADLKFVFEVVDVTAKAKKKKKKKRGL